MTDRRAFLATMSRTVAGAVAVPGFARLQQGSPRIEAEPTIFRANPDGRLTLVRFFVFGVDAPAGRLRVYDVRRRLLGTAGVIRSGDVLYGELWLPIERQTGVQCELESPGVRGIFHSDHSLRPKRRWTIYWLTVADPERLCDALDAMTPMSRAVHTAMLSAARVVGNPLADPASLATDDHLAFLRMALSAQSLDTRLGVRVTPVAVDPERDGITSTSVLALAGSGVRYVARPWESGDDAIGSLGGPDGSRVISVAIPPGGAPRSLGFTESQGEMTRRVERWLETTPLLLAPGGEDGVTFVLETDTEAPLAAMLAAVREWNRRFAYPHIVIGPADDLPEALGRASRPAFRSVPRLPDLATLTAIAESRRAAYDARVAAATRPVAALLDPGSTPEAGLETVARYITTALPGTLVLNPTPFHRTGVATMPDGSERLVTDVPGWGYAFLVDAPDRWGVARSAEPVPGPVTELRGEHLRLELDPRSGAITSLVTREDGREWVRSSGDGLNAVPGARVDKLSRQAIPGVGTRLIARRWSPARGNFTTTVTLYDDLPWVDVENDAVVLGRRPMEYAFGFNGTDARVAWEVPAGHEEANAPVDRFTHLRWITLSSGAGNVLFRGHDAPYASVHADGTLVSYAPNGRSRYRFEVTTTPVGPPAATRFGWGAEPLVATAVRANPDGRLPRHDALLYVDQPGVAIIGVKPADDGNGIIVYVQELMGSSRYISLGTGLLSFGTARIVDFIERDTGQEAHPVPQGVLVPLTAWGVAAVRLVDIGLGG